MNNALNNTVNNASFFNMLDYIYIAIMLISTVLGFKKGFTRVFLSTCALFSAGFLGAFLTPHLKIFLLNYIKDEYTADAIAASSSYLIGLIGLSICISYISSCIQKTFLSDLDRSAGALVGLIRGLTIPFGICFMMSIIGVKNNQYETTGNSRISTLMSNTIKNLMPNLPKTIPSKQIKSIYEKLKQTENDDGVNISPSRSAQKNKRYRQIIASTEPVARTNSGKTKRRQTTPPKKST
ncbi:MAG: CvpA family protein [Holosporaceae bacterium]|jgi:membrane protein required for colicin V production|nr:CvpA family protein [Holosporaceae bacterium]